MSEIRCECYKLILPRWDIMYCPHCNRQLAFIEVKHYSNETLSEKIKKLFKKGIIK